MGTSFPFFDRKIHLLQKFQKNQKLLYILFLILKKFFLENFCKSATKTLEALIYKGFRCCKNVAKMLHFCRNFCHKRKIAIFFKNFLQIIHHFLSMLQKFLQQIALLKTFLQHIFAHFSHFSPVKNFKNLGSHLPQISIR